MRTAAAIALLSVALILVSGAVFAHTAVNGARDQLRRQAVSQLELAVATRAFGGPLPPESSFSTKIVPRELVAALHGSTISTFDDGQSMWAARKADKGGVIATRLSNLPLDEQWSQLRQSFVWAAVLAVLVSSLIGWFVAGRLTARLRLAARSVNEVIAGRPGPSLDGHDEVAVISQGIAATAASLSARLGHEKAFAADVAHDLRTPLTALVSAAALLDDTEDSARVVAQVRRMWELVDDLLELARAEDDRESLRSEPLGLAATTEDCLSDLGVGPGGAASVELRVLSDAVVLADSSRVHRVITNLVSNALRHGAAPVTVTVNGPAIVVEDSGEGFPTRILDQGPRRFAAMGSQGGSGLGLAIVAHHVAAMDGVLTLGESSTGGARAEVVLPEDHSHDA